VIGLLTVALWGCPSFAPPEPLGGIHPQQEEVHMKKPSRQEFCLAALSLIGTPYEYGGRLMVPGGYGTDCWGLVADAMHVAGDEAAATTLAKWWTQRAFDELPLFVTACPAPGDLFFYGESATRISHVTICLGSLSFGGKRGFLHLAEDYLLSASGGNSNMKTREGAFKRDARVKLFSVNSYRRPDFVAARSLRDYLY